MFYVWLGVLAGMLLIGGVLSVGLIRGSVAERRRFDAQIARYGGRHEAGRPAKSPGARDDTRNDRVRDAFPRAAGAARTRGAQPPGHRPHVSADSIAPVWWTEPGKPQAAPSKHGAPHTSRMIRLDTATTGEIRAVGDRIVAAIEAGESLT